MMFICLFIRLFVGLFSVIFVDKRMIDLSFLRFLSQRFGIRGRMLLASSRNWMSYFHWSGNEHQPPPPPPPDQHSRASSTVVSTFNNLRRHFKFDTACIESALWDGCHLSRRQLLCFCIINYFPYWILTQWKPLLDGDKMYWFCFIFVIIFFCKVMLQLGIKPTWRRARENLGASSRRMGEKVPSHMTYIINNWPFCQRLYKGSLWRCWYPIQWVAD